jgi:hypothetical protein
MQSELFSDIRLNRVMTAENGTGAGLAAIARVGCGILLLESAQALDANQPGAQWRFNLTSSEA